MYKDSYNHSLNSSPAKIRNILKTDGNICMRHFELLALFSFTQPLYRGVEDTIYYVRN